MTLAPLPLDLTRVWCELHHACHALAPVCGCVCRACDGTELVRRGRLTDMLARELERLAPDLVEAVYERWAAENPRAAQADEQAALPLEGA